MTKDNKQKSFFQDLWDRRFFPLIGTYLGVSFGLIQFAEFLVNRYHFSSNIVDKLIIFLAVMLPSFGVFAYKHGKAGIQEWRAFEKIFISASLVFALILAGVFFNSDSAIASTETVSITDEEGETVTRVVPKAEFTKRFVIFPFENKTGSKEKDWLSVGGPYLLDKDLEQDMRTFSIQPLSLKYYYESYNYKYLDPIPFATELKIAQDNYSDYFITGVLEEEEERLKLSLKVNDSGSGEEFYANSLQGEDIYELIDGMSKDLNEQLYLESIDAEKIIDLPVSNLITPKLEALREYIEGELTWKRNVQNAGQAVQKLEQSVAIDPNCAECFSSLSQLYFAISNEDKMLENTDKAAQLAASLPERQQLNIRFYNYMAHNQPDRAVLLSENWRKLYPNDFTPYRNLIDYYRRILEWGKAKEIALAALDKGHKGSLLTTLASLYIQTEEFDEAEKYMKQFAKLYPHKAKDQTLLGDAYVKKGDLEKARDFYADLLIMAPDETKILLSLGSVEDKLGNFDKAMSYYQEALSKGNQTQDSLSAYANMEVHYERLGQYQKSFEINDRRRVLNNTIQPPSVTNQLFFFPQIHKYVNTGKDKKVLEDLDALTKQLPQSAQVLDCVGKYLYHMFMENNAEFEEYSNNCLAIMLQFNGPNFKYLDEGIKANLNGDYAKASEMYQTYIDSTGIGNTFMSADLSQVYRKGGRLDKAEEFINKLYDVDPHQPVVLIEKSKVLKEKGELAEARSLYDKAIEIWENADANFIPYQKALEYGKELNREQ